MMIGRRCSRFGSMSSCMPHSIAASVLGDISMSEFELAQLNVAVLKQPLDSPLMADFVGNLERINTLAEASSGFVWRLQTDDGDATALRPLGDDVLVNMSVWRDLASLRNYVYQSAHADIMRQRRRWFTQSVTAYLVLWWLPLGHRPSIAEATDRLNHLRQHGPSPIAFTFGKAFAAPDVLEPRAPFTLAADCPAT
jgi:hypothetical protein